MSSIKLMIFLDKFNKSLINNLKKKKSSLNLTFINLHLRYHQKLSLIPALDKDKQTLKDLFKPINFIIKTPNHKSKNSSQNSIKSKITPLNPLALKVTPIQMSHIFLNNKKKTYSKKTDIF